MVGNQNLFERHTLLNKLSARRKFYTATVKEKESVLKVSNPIRQLASSFKSMFVDIPECVMAMALFNCLPDDYNALISALDAVEDEDAEFQSEFIKSRIMHELQRIAMRTMQGQAKSKISALLSNQNHFSSSRSCRNRFGSSRSRPLWNLSKRLGQVEAECYIIFPHLILCIKEPAENKPDLLATQTDDDPVV